MTDLLPCPFCGTEPRLIDGRENEVGYFVRCEYCRIDYPSSVLNAAEKAVALWNTRAHIPALPQEEPDTGLKARGVGRMFDNEKAVLVIFDRKLTDDELRSLHDQIRILP